MTKRNYKLILIVSIGMILSLILLTSYALWKVKDGQTGSNQILGACLSISFEEEKDIEDNLITGITMEKAWPITDEEGISTKGYTFTVTNKCDTPVNYELVLETMKIPEPGNKMPDDFVKIRLDDKNIKRVSDLEEVDNDERATYANEIDSTYKIYTGTVTKENPETHIYRQWYSDDAIPDTIGYEYETKIKIYAGQGIVPMDEDEICYSILPDGTLTHYNPKCGKDVILPASYNGLPIKKIATNAFRNDITYSYDYFLNPGYTEDDIDFTIAVSDEFIEKLYDYYAETTDVYNPDAKLDIDDNDIWIVNYKNIDNLDEMVIDMLDNGIILNDGDTSYIFDARYWLAENQTDIHNVCNANDSSCQLGYIAWAFKIGSNEDEYEFLGYYGQGQAIWGAGFVDIDLRPLTIDSIDFSQDYNLLEIGEEAFGEYETESLAFPDSLEKIDSAAFWNYNGTNLVLNNNLKTIGDNAFQNYNGNALQLPDSVEYIGDSAFLSFNGETLHLPNSLEYLGVSSFHSYNGRDLILPPSLETIGQSAFRDYVGDDSELVIPDSVKIIDDSAFYNFSGTSLSLGNGLTKIGASAFLNYNTNSDLILPPNLKEIGSQAFPRYVGSGTELIIPNSVKTLGTSAFSKFNGDSLVLGTGLTNIPDGAFSDYSGEELIISNNVETIGNSAFEKFDGTNLVLNNNLKTIGELAFSSYSGDELILPNSLQTIGKHSFENYDGDSLIIPNSVTEIGAYAFFYFNKGNLVLGNNIKKIGERAFMAYYGKNTTLSLPSGLEIVEYDAFHSFSGDNVIIPASIKKIGYGAFESGGDRLALTKDGQRIVGTGIPQITIKMSEENFAKVEKGNNWYRQSTLVFDPD